MNNMDAIMVGWFTFFLIGFVSGMIVMSYLLLNHMNGDE